MAIFEAETPGWPLGKNAKNRTVSPLATEWPQNAGRILWQPHPIYDVGALVLSKPFVRPSSLPRLRCDNSYVARVGQEGTISKRT